MVLVSIEATRPEIFETGVSWLHKSLGFVAFALKQWKAKETFWDLNLEDKQPQEMPQSNFLFVWCSTDSVTSLLQICLLECEKNRVEMTKLQLPDGNCHCGMQTFCWKYFEGDALIPAKRLSKLVVQSSRNAFYNGLVFDLREQKQLPHVY